MSTHCNTTERNSSFFSNGITEEDWSRLHGRVIPNSVDFEEFKAIVSEGKLQDRYLAKDIHKIMQEMRDILLEHGELREAATFPVTGRKADLSRAAAAAVRVLNRERLRPPFTEPNSLFLSNRSDAPSSSLTLNSLVKNGNGCNVSTSNFIEEETPPVAKLYRVSCNSESRHPRPPPIVDHITDFPDSAPPVSLVAPLAAGPVAENHVSGSNSPQDAQPLETARASNVEPAPGVLGYPRDRILTTPVPKRLNSLPLNGINATPTTVGGMTGMKNTPVGSSTTTSSTSGSGGTEIMHFNDRFSPFFSILGIVRRFQLRYGSHSMKFEVPVQYANAVAARRLRIHLIPFRHPNLPARWPTAKEITIYVNDQCVLASWRRAWPERKQEVAKTFLSLDITQYINRPQSSQRLRIDVFNRDYFTPTLLAVVQSNALEDIVANFLEKRFGEGRISKIIEHLTVAAPPSDVSASTGVRSMLNQSDQRAVSFYRSILFDDSDETLAVGDPVISTKCSVSQMPIEVPVRGVLCRHLQCIDLRSHLLSSHKGCYWNCPLCDREMWFKDLVVDTFLWRRLCAMRETFPTHLRLSSRKDPCTRAAEAAADEVTSATSAPVASSPEYGWYPSNQEGGATTFDGGLLLADDADMVDQEVGQEVRRTAVVSPERERSTSLGAPLGSKRLRAPSPLPLSLEGTAENPIEL